MQNKFSIVLPVRNGGEYVKECVKSILAQTLVNYNLIVLDNNSTDGTLEWIRGLNNEKIIVYTSSSDLTIEENWARIKDIEKNEFITIIGHDDILLPNYLNTIVKLIEQFPNASLYQTHFDFIDRNSKKIKSCKKMPQKENVNQFLISFLNHTIDINGTGFMMRSLDYNSLGGIPTYYPNLLYADIELWLKLTALNYKATSLETAFKYRLHESTTKKTNTEKLNIAFNIFLNFILELKKENDFSNEVTNVYLREFINSTCLSFMHRLLKSPKNLKGNLNVSSILKSRIRLLNSFGINVNFKTKKQKIDYKIATLIDSSFATRNVFFWLNKFIRR